MAARGLFRPYSPDGGNRRRPGGNGRLQVPHHREKTSRPACDGQAGSWTAGSTRRRTAACWTDIEEAGVGYAFDPFDEAAEPLVHYWTLNMGSR